MTMQYDVKSAYTATFPAQLYTGRTRLKQFTFLANGTAGTITIRDGTSSSDPILWQFKTGTGVQPFQVLVPGEGYLAQTGLYVEATNISALTVTYG
jgi:hypothetical protein